MAKFFPRTKCGNQMVVEGRRARANISVGLGKMFAKNKCAKDEQRLLKTKPR